MTTLAARSAPTRASVATGRARRLLPAAFWVVVAAGVTLRCWTRSPLWLDEAQSVAIAKLPLTGHGPTLWTGLRQDGSPPLYYLLLHGWTALFGTGDLAVRSLSGVVAIAALPVVWRLADQIGGRRVATTAVVLLATSPFAVRFGTETRMYSLIVLLTAVGGLALRKLLVDGPTTGRFLGVAAVSGLLALTHYWAFFLLATVGICLVVARRWVALLALVAGGVLFVPWTPIFVSQLQHTGTPWGEPAAYSAVVHAFADWAGGDTTSGRALLLLLFAFLALGLFGIPVDQRHVMLDLHGRSPVRLVATVTVGTLLVAVTLNQVVGGAWQDRYTAVAFVPFVVWAGFGVRALSGGRTGVALVGAAAVLGLVASSSNLWTYRTNAPSVARVLRAEVRPGDVVVTCPDQLGPGLSRLLPASVPVLGVPTLTSAARVDWVDYKKRQQAADPASLAAAIGARAPHGTVWFVVSHGYLTYEPLCTQLQEDLTTSGRAASTAVADPGTTFEHEGLLRFAPTG